MYLSKLELQGFKSFADRTVLHFDPGITAIVGPNGCGKSNIVDAVRWVVGEQRARILRSEKMENVIFNGTSKRRPLGMSEVLLTIENNRGVLPTEYSEVELGRRLYRSGDSEYLMNNVQCRLKDITDMFMDTGMGAGAYSVIELKMIEEILSENADDRRRLFEEAAGITKYKLRRRQTLNKLESTQTDLTRIRDLTDEIGKQVRSLHRQAKKAEKYREASERLHALELALAQVEYTRLLAQKELLEEEIRRLQNETEKAGTSESTEESSLQRLREDLQARERELEARRQDLNQHLEEVRALETERRLAEERIESARRELQRTHAEQEAATSKRLQLEQEIDELKRALEEARPALEKAMEELESARAERDASRTAAEARQKALQDLRRKERELEARQGDQRRQLDRLLNRRELIEEDIQQTRFRLDDLAKALEEIQQRVTEADEARAQAERAADDARAELEKAAQDRAFKQDELHAARESLREIERRRDALSAEAQLLESMLTSYEDFSGAVKYLAESDWSVDDLRTVADVLACDEQDRIALDAALGAYAACIVVSDDQEALRAVEVLRRDEQGRATFIVLNRLKTPAPDAQSAFAEIRLRDRVRTVGPEYDRLADLLLRDTFIVDTLEEAQDHAQSTDPDARFIARTGEWVDSKGIVYGGSRQEGVSPASGRLGRREQLAAAQKELDRLDRQYDEAKERVEQLEKEQAAIPYDEYREALATAERHLTETEKLAARVSFELKSSDRRHEELQEKQAQAQVVLASLAEEARAMELAVKEAGAALEAIQARAQEAETHYEAADQESRRAAGQFNQANIAAIEARNRLENTERDLERSNREITELDEAVERRKRRIVDLDQTITDSEEHLGTLAAAWSEIEGRRQHLDEAVAYAEEAVQQTREAIQHIEGGLRGLRRQREVLLREENQRNVRVAEIQTRAQDLAEHIEEEYNLWLPRAIEDGTIEVPEDFDEKEARSEVAELRRDIRALGSVNELALEAYEEEKERLEFLLQQQEDLERAEEKLIETIDEINTTASERFMETYEEIRANFTRIFRDLFGNDAAADLVLENPDDPLETAIEINARPRGKRPSTISQLSGGEKTLTAIALLFGIYLVKPSPFCILDEVDAPLDDANVERFMRLIRQFAKDTQFILVTHNKLTMQAADRLYGITMQEQGVSRLVGVKFDEAVEIADREAPREAA